MISFFLYIMGLVMGCKLIIDIMNNSILFQKNEIINIMYI